MFVSNDELREIIPEIISAAMAEGVLSFDPEDPDLYSGDEIEDALFAVLDSEEYHKTLVKSENGKQA